MSFLDRARWPVAAVAGAWIALASSLPAGAASPFAGLSGSWSGRGEIRLENDRSEAIRCRAHYDPRGGSALGLDLRCASAGNRIELRASLRSRGSRVFGTWEERSYNTAGSVSGRASGNTLRLSINGGGLSGFMRVTTIGRSQSISVRTDGTGLRGVSIRLRRRN
jgi:hypothetical protein